MKLKIYASWIIIFYTAGLFSSPRIIIDNRIEDLNGFPSPGRGYSMSSNTLQSMCFKSVTTTKPTFDLSYDIEEISDDYLSKLLVSGKNRIQNTRLNNFIKDYYSTEETSGGRKYILKNLVVKAEVNQYYYSMDETNSNLSDSVKELLKNRQYVTFFNSCGHFYVRSVGTFSTYYALLQYRLTGTGDDEFRSKLEKGLFNFYDESTPLGEKGKEAVSVSRELRDDAIYRGLKVYVQGIGLSKGEPVNLIPVNIQQFRTTIQEAVKLMQSPDAGLVNAIEVVPWMENPEFGRILLSDDKGSGAEQFIRQQKIEENTGVITEIYRKSKHQLELYNISSMCRRVIVDEFADKTEGSLYRSFYGQGTKPEEEVREFTLLDQVIMKKIIDDKIRKYDGNRTLFYNLSNENDENGYITLNDYIRYFHVNPSERFLDINRFYLYGNEDKENDGALRCINQLHSNLDQVTFRDIPSCVEALKDVELNSLFLDQYCLPKPVQVVYQGDEEDAKKNPGRQDKSEQRIIIPEKPKSLEDIGSLQDIIEDNSEEGSPAEDSGGEKAIESFQDMVD